MSVEMWDQSDGAAAAAKTGAALGTGSAGITVCDVKGVPIQRRAGVEAAVTAGGVGLSEHLEAWVVPARKPPAFVVRIVGPRGFYREIRFAGRETEAEIEQSIRRATQV